MRTLNSTNGDAGNQALMPDAGKVNKIGPAKSWGTGIRDEFKKTVRTHWVSEMTNFNQKTVAVSLLMFITVVAPTVTFGAVYSRNTENHIGAVETILATAWTGIFLSLTTGMPISITGSTGPILIMTTVMYDMSKSMDIPFLSLYAWVSIWVFGFCTLGAFFDVTRYIDYATRFTDDIFALLIVTIYILNAIGSPFAEGGLLRYLDPNNEFHIDQEKEQAQQQQANDDDSYNVNEVALLSIILGFGTTATIFFLRGFKTSPYFCNQEVRNALHDFAVTTAVILWTLVANFGFSGISLPGLHVSDTFQPTYTCCDASCTTYWPDDCETQDAPAGVRPWIADLGDLNGKGWVPGMAGGLALLAFILLYLDNGITWHFLYNPSHKITHGPTYNWDLFLNGVCNLVNGMLGLPWLVSTTVPCIVHLHNLAEKDKHGQIIQVQETRLTFLGSHTILGLSLLFLSTLKQIPLPVLLGVFLFMGLSSMPSLQFWQRILLFFQQPSHYFDSDKPYIKYMDTKRIHYYTLFQLAFFLGVFVVQNTESIALVFPFMTLLCIPARIYLAPLFFEGWELCLLDGYDTEVDEWLALKQEALEAQEIRAMMEGNEGDVVDCDCCPSCGNNNNNNDDDDDDDAVSGTTSRQTTENREDDVLVVVKMEPDEEA